MRIRSFAFPKRNGDPKVESGIDRPLNIILCVIVDWSHALLPEMQKLDFSSEGKLNGHRGRM